MSTLVKQKYTSTEAELYSIANLGINNLEADLALFAAKKAKYVAAFVAALRQLRTNAMALPNEEQRNEVHQSLGGQLPGLVVGVKDNFNDLKGYIRDGWPNEEPKPKYESAGLNNYNAIGEHNWENVVELNNSMREFISNNSAVLTTPGGMPATFAQKVQNDTAAFDAVYGPFLTSRETATARAAKITANNVLYDAMMDFMKDGVEMVFRTDAEQQKRYTFSTLKDLVSPRGASSLKVKVENGLNILQAGRPVVIKKPGSAPINGVTGVDGTAVFPADAGKYEGDVTREDGTLVHFTKEVETGVDARVVVVV